MSVSVLLVEDSALVVGALHLLLSERGFAVQAASGVREAIEACRHKVPDVMLLDLSLGDGSGLDVLAALAAPTRPRVTVAITGHDERRVREDCLRAGCRDVLVKPIDSMTLAGRISDWLAEEEHRVRA
ncbi:MAG TPA: response regulator [Gemmatimonadaceae bacterium]|nr:response regulator [Gemmatimonadaceae bacterium]